MALEGLKYAGTSYCLNTLLSYSATPLIRRMTIGNFLLGGFREATTAPSIEFSPDSTGTSSWVTNGSSVSLDVWSSMGGRGGQVYQCSLSGCC